MAGPLMFALVLGFALLMAGKLHFGYIYGFGMVGSLAVYLLVNLMAGACRGGAGERRAGWMGGWVGGRGPISSRPLAVCAPGPAALGSR